MFMKRALILAAAMLVLAQGAHAAESKRQFLRQSIQNDDAEIALGVMAAHKAGSPAVRRFGKELAADHRLARNFAINIATGMHMPAPPEKPAAALGEESRLQNLSGRKFDSEFLRYIVKTHEAAIRKVGDEAKALGGQAGQMAQRELPVLKQHLQQAKALERSI